jgi:orotidine-5'-phosphate decarboxylase
MGAPRDHLALAVDVDDLVEATRLARQLRPWFGVAKVGLELFSAAGPVALTTLRELGFRVFADLKLHDIPTTVERAATVLGSLGVSYVTLHAAGGEPMLRAGVEGLMSGAAAAGSPAPIALAVTVLTSEADVGPAVFSHRVAAAAEAGCGGLVCAAAEVTDAKVLAPSLVCVVPGIRPAGTPSHDQARAATPGEAIARGADLLVVGRAVTRADDPVEAAAAVTAEVAAALTVPGHEGTPR